MLLDVFASSHLVMALSLMLIRPLHIVLAAFLLFSTGCLGDAERSNPLDPLSDDWTDTGTFMGRTTRFYPPHSPLRNTEVRLTPGPHITQSDADGRFIFRDVPTGVYRISAQTDGFVSAPESLAIEAGSANPSLDLRLNGLPVIKSFELRAIHIDRWWPGELYQLEVLAMVEDPDGLSDIARVWFEIPGSGYVRALQETGIAGHFRTIVPADSLPGGSLHRLQGQDIILNVSDAVGFEIESAPKLIVRVIDMTPVALDPQAQETIEDPAPLFVWEDAALPFEYTYRVDVVLDQANVQNVVRTITDVPADRTSLKLETPLAAGTYFWTISVVDAFGNRSRSKEAGFIVP